jgi:mRNA-degrading endonuclease RelE of RelBE toxin-antitoxin system
LRVGDWRVVYEIRNPEQLVMLHVIDHRSRIYRRTPPRT